MLSVTLSRHPNELVYNFSLIDPHRPLHIDSLKGNVSLIYVLMLIIFSQATDLNPESEIIATFLKKYIASFLLSR